MAKFQICIKNRLKTKIYLSARNIRIRFFFCLIYLWIKGDILSSNEWLVCSDLNSNYFYDWSVIYFFIRNETTRRLDYIVPQSISGSSAKISSLNSEQSLGKSYIGRLFWVSVRRKRPYHIFINLTMCNVCNFMYYIRLFYVSLR